MITFAGEHDSLYPTPGSLRPVEHIDSKTADRSVVQDFSLNHSAPMYSCLIAQRYVDPEILVTNSSCIDEVDHVRVKSDYNYDAYKPAVNSYWDSTFVMRIDDPDIGANCSYAHMAICGDRRDQCWRDTQAANVPVLSTRGTRNGVTSGPDYERSPTLRIFGAKNQWDGHVAFADNHTDTFTSFFPTNVKFDDGSGKLAKDNIFAAEFNHPSGHQAAPDAFLGVFIGATVQTVEAVYDPLE